VTQALTQALLAGRGIDHSCANPQCIETHISWVILLGDYAYKIKKPLNLGFLDYTSLDLRQFYCTEELRLNRRTAPSLYLCVVGISGSAARPVVKAIHPDQPLPQAIFEYAVKMRRFPQSQLLGRLALEDRINEPVVNALAKALANFHSSLAKTVPPGFQLRERIHGPVLDNFQQLRSLARLVPQEALETLQLWSEREYLRIEDRLRLRYQQGHIRECHGDLHLDNILFDGNQCTVFDGIEFNPDLYWIDTASDLAFTCMDLQVRAQPGHAKHLLNTYLAHTGDYGMLEVFNYYCVYRALVRAKVEGIRAKQSVSTSTTAHVVRCQKYISHAQAFCQPRLLGLVLMCGYSGSGKTTLARQLGKLTGFIHLRSDVERKRLFGLSLDANSHSQFIDIYTEQASEQTKLRLLELCKEIISAGYGVIIDATFLSAGWRQPFLQLASKLSLPIKILHCQVSADAARQRLMNRQADASEATFNQFLHQQAAFEPFAGAEKNALVAVNTEDQSEIESVLGRLADGFERAFSLDDV